MVYLPCSARFGQLKIEQSMQVAGGMAGEHSSRRANRGNGARLWVTGCAIDGETRQVAVSLGSRQIVKSTTMEGLAAKGRQLKRAKEMLWRWRG